MGLHEIALEERGCIIIRNAGFMAAFAELALEDGRYPTI